MAPSHGITGWIATPGTHALGSYALGPVAAIVPADIDIPTIVAEVKANGGVSAPDEEIPALQKVVSQAHNKGYDLKIVVIDERMPTYTYYRDIATAIQDQTSGTVVVFGPTDMGTASNAFTRVQLEQARDNMTVGEPTVASQQLLDRLTADPQTPWTLITALLVVAVILAAVGARVLQLRGRRSSVVTAGADAVGTDDSPAVGVSEDPRPSSGAAADTGDDSEVPPVGHK